MKKKNLGNSYQLIARIYNYDEINELIDNHLRPLKLCKKRGKNSVVYLNYACSFDIETTSYIDDKKNKVGIMYVWQMCLNGACIYGRTYEEFLYVCKNLTESLELNGESRRLIIYVHNLAFEHSFIKKWFNWTQTFALKEREPVYCISEDGFEFRCSYVLTGYSLESLGKRLTRYKVSKLVGDLDYSLARHSKTYLTPKELEYCFNDVRVVASYIQEKIEEENNRIYNIPLTKTSYVRRYCRNKCLPHNNGTDYYKYYNMIHNLNITPDEYLLAKRVFGGGFTHANAYRTDKIYNNVGSFDICSSYPATMLSEEFPMSSGKKVVITSAERFNYYLRNFCCIFDIELTDVIAKVDCENIISLSKCSHIEDYVVNNGRIVRASKIITSMTNVDFELFTKYYDFKSLKTSNFYYYRKGYLPKALIEAVLELYEKKTTLKGLDDVESLKDYQQAKENINSVFGMMVMDIYRPEIKYDNIRGWYIEDSSLDEQIEIYNNNKKRFTFYLWGIFITSYSRYHLLINLVSHKLNDKNLGGIGIDYIYSDTDSLKIKNYNRYTNIIEEYNKWIIAKIDRCLSKRGIDIERARPKTIKGKIKQLGIFEFEYEAYRFKTLGSKRYIYELDDGLHITIAGLHKLKACYFLGDGWSYEIKTHKEVNSPFDKFSDGLVVDEDNSGKLTHTYIDEMRTGEIIDYMGVKGKYTELSSVHLSPSSYNLSLAKDYINYLLGIKLKRAML